MELGADHFGRRLLCVRRPACAGTHGCHPDGSPMGTPAPAHVRRARSAAHASFDRLWSEGTMTRSQAYAWMREAMGLSREEAHISRMDAARCRELVRKLEEAFPNVFPFTRD